MDIKVGKIHSSYVKNKLCFCATYDNVKLGDKVHNVSIIFWMSH